MYSPWRLSRLGRFQPCHSAPIFLISVRGCLRGGCFHVRCSSAALCKAAALSHGSTLAVLAIINHTLNTPHSAFPMGGCVFVCANECVYSVAQAARWRTFKAAYVKVCMCAYKCPCVCVHYGVPFNGCPGDKVCAWGCLFCLCVLEEKTPPMQGREDTQGHPLFIFPDVSLHLASVFGGGRSASLVKLVNMLIFPWFMELLE